MFEAMPSPIKIASSLNTNETPITVKEGRYFINELFSNEEVAYTRIEDDKENNISEDKAAIKMKDVWFKYEKDGNDVLKDLNFEVKSGEFFCVVGGNGTGKSTTVSLICGIRKPYRGKIEIFGKNIQEYKNKELFDNNLAILPQDPQALFVKNTVEKDLYEMLPKFGMSKNVHLNLLLVHQVLII